MIIIIIINKQVMNQELLFCYQERTKNSSRLDDFQRLIIKGSQQGSIIIIQSDILFIYILIVLYNFIYLFLLLQSDYLVIVYPLTILLFFMLAFICNSMVSSQKIFIYQSQSQCLYVCMCVLQRSVRWLIVKYQQYQLKQLIQIYILFKYQMRLLLVITRYLFIYLQYQLII
ncbi:hypothetical protein ABPG74_017253 [Tetrahymena malaccensis]